ncbi:MAG: sigma-70 family RNA polymerase sigma factor [Clostridiales bacterium]|nr:sigma-70 family RNA polymerase sigma factor [Clostridiales bacterium]
MINKADAQRIALKYYSDIYSFCISKLNNTDVASDVTQDVFLFFQEKGDVLEDYNIRAWLYSVAEKKLHEKIREMYTKAPLSYDDELCPMIPPVPFEELYEEMALSDTDVETVKHKLLKKLTPEEQELFNMLYKKHLSNTHISQKLGISEGALSVRSARLRIKIKNLAKIAFLLIFFVAARLDT